MVMSLELTDEQRMLQRSAADFAKGSLRPLIERVHREGRPADPWEAFAPVYREGVALGLTKLFLPPEHGGSGASCIDAVIALEELGAVDVGVASDYFSLTMCMPLMMMRGGTEAQKAEFLGAFGASPDMVLAGAQSEPNVAGSELMAAGPNPLFGPRMSAKADGDAYVLHGDKSAFVTNAGVASSYFIIARTHPELPVMQGLTIFHVPADTPGVTVGRKTPLIGWPLSAHAQLSFDDVRVPASSRVGPEGGAAMAFAQIPEMPICLAACFVGLARAAYDYAFDYARTRVSCGVPIIQHQAVSLKLAAMAVELHGARLMVWDAALACESDPMGAAMFKAPAAKTRAVDAAIRNAQLCMEILGGYGVTTEYEAGRFLNDAWIGYSCDFTKDILYLGIAQGLMMQAG